MELTRSMPSNNRLIVLIMIESSHQSMLNYISTIFCMHANLYMELV
jgi:hypothetical protein